MSSSPAFDLRSGSEVKGALLVRVDVVALQPFAGLPDVLDGYLVDHLPRSVSDALHDASQPVKPPVVDFSARAQRESQIQSETERFQGALLEVVEGSQQSVPAPLGGAPLAPLLARVLAA